MRQLPPRRRQVRRAAAARERLRARRGGRRGDERQLDENDCPRPHPRRHVQAFAVPSGAHGDGPGGGGGGLGRREGRSARVAAGMGARREGWRRLQGFDAPSLSSRAPKHVQQPSHVPSLSFRPLAATRRRRRAAADARHQASPPPSHAHVHSTPQNRRRPAPPAGRWRPWRGGAASARATLPAPPAPPTPRPMVSGIEAVLAADAAPSGGGAALSKTKVGERRGGDRCRRAAARLRPPPTPAFPPTPSPHRSSAPWAPSRGRSKSSRSCCARG
jgi:hypothetical protein